MQRRQTIKTFVWRQWLRQKLLKWSQTRNPWFNCKPRALLKRQDGAFKSGAYKEALRNLWKGIKETKRKYKQQLEEHFTANNCRSMWQGIKTLTGYKDGFKDTNSKDRTLLDILIFPVLTNRAWQHRLAQWYQGRTRTYSWHSTPCVESMCWQLVQEICIMTAYRLCFYSSHLLFPMYVVWMYSALLCWSC